MSTELQNPPITPRMPATDESSGNSNGASNTASLSAPHLGILTYAVVALILCFISVVMYWALSSQLDAYKQGIANAIAGQDIDHSAVLAYSLATTLSVVKISSVFLAFLMIFLGGIYLLLPLHADYRLRTQNSAAKGSLESNSPGLIVITLGVVLASVTLMTKSSVNYTSPTIAWEPSTNQVASADSSPSTNVTTAPAD